MANANPVGRGRPANPVKARDVAELDEMRANLVIGDVESLPEDLKEVAKEAIAAGKSVVCYPNAVRIDG